MATASSSAESGYLAPVSNPGYDLALEDVLQPAIAAITGIDPSLVRPRWQTNPPAQPDFNANWCSFGVTELAPDQFAHQAHTPSGDGGLGTSELSKDELITVLHSFYGPGGQAACERFRDGVQIAQNRAELLSAGLAVVEVQASRAAPALMEQRWVRKTDVSVVYRRRVVRSFAIRTIQSATPTIQSARPGLDNEIYVTPVVVNHP